MSRFAEDKLNALPPRIHALVQQQSAEVFLVMLALVTVLAGMLTFWGARRESRSPGAVSAMTLVIAGLLFNGLHHLGASLLLGGYAPGAVTSAVLLIPAAILLIRKACADRWISRRQWFGAAAAGLLLMGPVILASRQLALLLVG